MEKVIIVEFRCKIEEREVTSDRSMKHSCGRGDGNGDGGIDTSVKDKESKLSLLAISLHWYRMKC